MSSKRTSFWASTLAMARGRLCRRLYVANTTEISGVAAPGTPFMGRAVSARPGEFQVKSSQESHTRGREPLHRLLDNRQVDHCRQHAEQDREPPHHVVGPGALIGDSADQDAQEAADLMTEEREARQHGEPARAEHHGDETVGG